MLIKQVNDGRVQQPMGRDGDTRIVLDRHQRLGILPSWWFWRDSEVRKNPIVRRLLLPAQAAICGVGFMSWGMFLQPLLPGTMFGRAIVSGIGGALMACSASALTFGVAERFLRRKILARREQVEAAMKLLNSEAEGTGAQIDVSQGKPL